MFHPGGFGGPDYAQTNLTLCGRISPQADPVSRYPFVWLGPLLWVGLWLGLGWYAWPLGSVVLISAFISFSIVLPAESFKQRI